MRVLLKILFALTRRPAIGFGLMVNAVRGKKSQVRTAQFIGFLEDSGFRRANPDRHTKLLNRRRAAMNVLFLLLLIGFAWIMMESAHALTLFWD